MRYLTKIGIIALAFFFVSGQLFGQDVFTGTDKSLQTDFSKLETFTWASHAEGDDAVYTLNDLALKNFIRDAIGYELKARGYTEVEENADFLVNFRVFDEPGKFPGYVDVYKDENYWSPTELRKDLIGLTPDAEIRERDDIRQYRFKDGTILIDFVDMESYSRIWTGYGSGIKDDYVLDRSKDGIRKVIQKIFSEYEFKAGEGAG